MTRHLCAWLAAALLLGAACSDTEPSARAAGGSGGDGGAGGSGGTGGTEGPATCADLDLPGALADGAWSTGFSAPGLTGQDGFGPRAFDLALDEGGALVAAGYFSWAGTRAVPPLARLQDGKWQSARQEWNLAPPAAGFSAVAMADGKTALATHSALEPHDGEIWIDTGAGLEVAGHFDGLVRTMVWRGAELWVAGNFVLDEGGAAGLSVWDGTAWKAPPGGGPDGPVYELLPEGDAMLVGGAFTSIGGIDAGQIASWDGTAWTALDLGMPGTVYGLARGSDGALYAGGALFRDPEEGRGGIARFDGTSWELLGEGVASGMIPGVVSDLAVFHGELYVTGCFTHVGGAASSDGATASRSIARWNGLAWQPMQAPEDFVNTAWFNPSACGDEGPDSVWNMEQQRFLATQERLYVAGAFAGLGGVASQSVIAWDGESWLPLGEGGEGISGTIDDLAVGGPDCAVHAIGQLTHAGGKPARAHVLRWAGAWEPVGAPMPDGLECTRLEVDADGRIFVGCTDWGEEGDPPLARVYAVGDDGWTAAGETPGMLTDMQMDATGAIWIAGGAEKGFVARLDGDAFTVVEDGFDGIVWRFATAPSGEKGLVASGMFANVGDTPANRIARWDGSGWSALGDGMAATVTAVAYGHTGIYAATTFEGDPARAILARWDGATWTELATPANGIPAPLGGSVHTFTALLERGGELIATGYVWPETGGRNAFAWDGERFTSIGGGLAAISVDAVALAKDGLWFGGTIAEAGLGGERIPTVGVARFEWK